MRIAVLDDYQKVARTFGPWQRLAGHADIDFLHDVVPAAQRAERLAAYDVLCVMRERTPLPAALIAALPQLKLIVTTGRANASIDVMAAAARGIVVSGTDSPGHATAELAISLILALSRNLLDETASLLAGNWQVSVGRDLHGATLGIIGLGRLGTQVATIGNAFGMHVIAWSQNLTEQVAQAHGVVYVTKERLFSEANFITVHLQLSDRTRGLIGVEEIALMKRDAYLVNTSRGPIIDTVALRAALQEGRIAGAALDVYDEEPLAPNDPLRDTPNLIATPHIGYVTRETYRVFYEQTVEAIEAFLGGHPVRVVTP